jgi:hypothetical protein
MTELLLTSCRLHVVLSEACVRVRVCVCVRVCEFF